MKTPRRPTGRAEFLADGSVQLTFSYNPGVTAWLKELTPASARVYDPASHIWTLAPELADIGIHMLCFYLGDVEVVEVERSSSRRPEPTPIRTSDAAFRALHLQPSAPAELVQAAYRCLARIHHPDVSGATSNLQIVNEAYEQLKARGAA